MTSPDGITWTLRTSAADNGWTAIAWNGTVFAAVSFARATVMTSPDGITWTTRVSTTATLWQHIAWNGLGTAPMYLLPAAGSGTVFAAVSASGTGNRVMTNLFYKRDAT